MKEIKAVIQPFKLNDVLDALHGIEGVTGVMSSQVSCTNAERGRINPDINTRIELYVDDGLVDEVLDAIRTQAHTGRPGDGRIFVTDVSTTVRISSGERHYA